MQITIDEPFDFSDKLLDYDGRSVDLLFTASKYEDGAFNILCADQYDYVKLTGHQQTQMIDSSFNLCGRRIQVTDFLFDCPVAASAVFSAQAQDTILVQGCTWLYAQLDAKPGLSILHIEPGSGQSTMELTDCWIMGNYASEGHQIIGTRTLTSSKFISLAFHRTAFINNEADTIIGAFSGDQVTFRDCFILFQDERSLFLGGRTKEATIKFSRCFILSPSIQQVASQWASDALPGDFNPVVFEDCQIYLTGSEAVPDDVRLINTKVNHTDPLAGNDFDSWLIQCEEAARAGESPDHGALGRSLLQL